MSLISTNLLSDNQKPSIFDIFDGSETIKSYREKQKEFSYIKKEFSEKLNCYRKISSKRIGNTQSFQMKTPNGGVQYSKLVFTEDGPLTEETIENELFLNSEGLQVLGRCETYAGFMKLQDETGKQINAYVDATHIVAGDEHQSSVILMTENGIKLNLSDTSYEESPTGEQFDFINQVKASFNEEYLKAQALTQNDQTSATTPFDGPAQ